MERNNHGLVILFFTILIFILSTHGFSEDQAEKIIRVNMSFKSNGSFQINDVRVSMGYPQRECKNDCSGNYMFRLVDSNGEEIYATDARITFDKELASSFISEEELGRSKKKYTYIFLKFKADANKLVVQGEKQKKELYLKDNLCNRDGECGGMETHYSCPDDCSFEDDYCTKIENGICDPDCPGKDIDCLKEKQHRMSWILIGAIAIVFLISLVVVYIKQHQHKKRKEHEHNMMEWIEERLKAGDHPEMLKAVVKAHEIEEEMVDRIMERL